MTKIPEIPPELWPIRDAAIEHAQTGTSLPPDDMQSLYEWLEDDGWDAIIDAWEGEEVALDFRNFARDHLSDAGFHATCVLEEGDELNDTRRVEYARNQIEYVFTGEDGRDVPSVHTYRIKRGDGKSAVIGCTVESRGQGAPSFPVWHGVFPTKEAFIGCLREAGVLLRREVEALDDAAILAAWQVD